MILIALADNDRNALTKLRQSPSDPRSEKALAVLLSGEGHSIPSISTRLKRHHHTVRGWIKRYQQHGIAGLERKPPPGRPSIRKKSIQPFIEGLIKENPEDHGYRRSCWTLEMLRLEYEKNSNKKTSTDSIKRALKDLGYSFKKAKATLPENSPSKADKVSRVEEMLSEIKCLMTSTEINQTTDVYAVDESHFSTQPYLPRGWFKKRNSNSCSYIEEEGEFFSFRCFTDQGWEVLLEKRKVG